MKRKTKPTPSVTVDKALNEAKAQEWLQNQGAKDLALLLMGALVCAYRLGRYGVAEGDFLTADERTESLETMKPLTYLTVKQIHKMGANLYD